MRKEREVAIALASLSSAKSTSSMAFVQTRFSFPIATSTSTSWSYSLLDLGGDGDVRRRFVACCCSAPDIRPTESCVAARGVYECHQIRLLRFHSLVSVLSCTLLVAAYARTHTQPRGGTSWEGRENVPKGSEFGNSVASLLIGARCWWLLANERCALSSGRAVVLVLGHRSTW